MERSDRHDGGGVPAAVRELLRSRVQSFEQLEVLLLVSGAPQQPWTAADAAAALRWTVDVTTEALQRLQAGGLLASPSPGAFRFECAPELARAVEALRRCWADDRLVILRLMNEQALEQMRIAMLQTLAEAFRLRRREP